MLTAIEALVIEFAKIRCGVLVAALDANIHALRHDFVIAHPLPPSLANALLC